ncbi:hypothetical protein CANARDRAFT_176748 [[Candida] arabinofermentans NRRL YB-2248]|uniref:Peptidase S8/S53 domain-containing protein n=1 Tax=[Candida] arabinofermentans NRRL YB-2248 TaxID=983967 RepID=A0A1E4SYE7_9ASCO|nr:hypothetical protein CANARDRAFT_176748 [[Candida] arabinofermentans NRRL YB-2248]
MRYSVALSILASLVSINALVIPSFDDLPSEIVLNDFKLVNKEDSTTTSSFSSDDTLKPLIVSETASLNLIPHSYIIVLKSDISSEQIDLHKQWVDQIHSETIQNLNDDHPFVEFIKTSSSDDHGFTGSFSISNLFNGYTGYFPSEVIDLIRLHPDVAFVEHDSRVFAIESETQTGAPWGLSRISHRDRLSLGNFNQYIYDDVAGEGVTAYVIDTGINVDHVEFNGRAKWGKTIPQGDDDIDGNGHGTHCAGTIGSEHYGVSKNANIVAIKVLRSNGSGSMADVVKGVEFAANSHLAESKSSKKGFKGSTANMSLGGGKSPALDLAVNAAVKAGLHFAVAAGNDNADACNYSPAAAENAVTVGASTLGDARAYFSNYGKCVDIFGPGLNILSTYIGSNSATATLSGTSMASPHVCGLLTYYLSLQPESDSLFSSSSITPAQLKKNLIKYGTKNALSEIPDDGTPNILIYNGAGKNISDFWNSEFEQIEFEFEEEEFKIDINEINSKLKEIEVEALKSVKSYFDSLI